MIEHIAHIKMTTTPSKFSFFTWRFHDQWHPRSVTVLAKSREAAIIKVLRCVRENKILRMEGPYTRYFEEILKDGKFTTFKGDRSFEEMIRNNEPVVTDSDCMISFGALDG